MENRIHNTWCGISSVLFFIALLFLLLDLRRCKQDAPKEADKTASDTVVRYSYLNKWYPLVVKIKEPADSFPYLVPALIDTAAILRSFFTEYNYTDTIQDTNILAISRIRIFENKIRDHKLDYKILRPDKIVTITNTVTEPIRSRIMFGLAASLDKQFSFSAGPQILFVSKQWQTIGIGYDLVNNRLNANIYIPIRLR